jgi:hypothetical protein
MVVADGAQFSQGLVRLRKKGKWRGFLSKGMPQGLKPAFLFRHLRPG